MQETPRLQVLEVLLSQFVWVLELVIGAATPGLLFLVIVATALGYPVRSLAEGPLAVCAVLGFSMIVGMLFLELGGITFSWMDRFHKYTARFENELAQEAGMLNFAITDINEFLKKLPVEKKKSFLVENCSAEELKQKTDEFVELVKSAGVKEFHRSINTGQAYLTRVAVSTPSLRREARLIQSGPDTVLGFCKSIFGMMPFVGAIALYSPFIDSIQRAILLGAVSLLTITLWYFLMIDMYRYYRRTQIEVLRMVSHAASRDNKHLSLPLQQKETAPA